MTSAADLMSQSLSTWTRNALIAATFVLWSLSAASADSTSTLSIGRPASPEDIARWDIDIGPNGAGLPTGVGTAADGESIFMEKCASCHGTDGKIGRDKLVGVVEYRTVGNHWPYATTLFDYIRRAMPVPEPGSLSDAEVYSLTAFVLYLNDIVARDQALNASTLPEIVMPARDRFVPDDRRGGPEVR